MFAEGDDDMMCLAIEVSEDYEEKMCKGCEECTECGVKEK